MTLQHGNKIGNSRTGGKLSARKLDAFERRVNLGVRPAPGQLVKSNAFGHTITPMEDTEPRRTSSAGGSVEIMSLVSVHEDHLICQRDDDTEVLVAKPFLLRVSPFDTLTRKNAAGQDVRILNTADDGQERQVTNMVTGNRAFERVSLPYIVGDEIAVAAVNPCVLISVSGGVDDQGAPLPNVPQRVTQLDLNDGRSWAVRTVRNA